ncbi:DUF6226 family protein [Prescottella equi]|uniref:DUF6226 family protein n=1 Tax=Rhodococcus hoagii TaxID=43767 RepID=UPI001F301533|nr:DUF6226 family protein [Prescottella equi]
MGADPDMSWWERYNTGIRRMHETGWGADVAVLSREICELLDDVDATFAVTGAAAPGWPNPYEDGAEPDEAEYERLTNPDKFVIVVARARAWTRVLRDRRWAREGSHVEWALRPIEPRGVATVLEPTANGAVPLLLTTHTPVDSDHICTVTVAAGDPAVRMAEIPDCGCDACDRGSAALLEELDRWVLAIVDGSLQVDVHADGASIRSSFGARGGTVQHLDQPTSFTAAPWSANWTPRPIPGGRD